MWLWARFRGRWRVRCCGAQANEHSDPGASAAAKERAMQQTELLVKRLCLGLVCLFH